MERPFIYESTPAGKMAADPEKEGGGGGGDEGGGDKVSIAGGLGDQEPGTGRSSQGKKYIGFCIDLLKGHSCSIYAVMRAAKIPI